MTQGFLAFFIAAAVFVGLVGFCVLSIAHIILARIQSRLIRLIILILGMGVPMIFLIRIDTLMMIDAALALAVPFAVLVPPHCFPQYIGDPAGF